MHDAASLDASLVPCLVRRVRMRRHDLAGRPGRGGTDHRPFDAAAAAAERCLPGGRRQVICDTFLVEEVVNEPIADFVLPCGTIYETSHYRGDGTRWYVDGKVVDGTSLRAWTGPGASRRRAQGRRYASADPGASGRSGRRREMTPPPSTRATAATASRSALPASASSTMTRVSRTPTERTTGSSGSSRSRRRLRPPSAQRSRPERNSLKGQTPEPPGDPGGSRSLPPARDWSRETLKGTFASRLMRAP